MKKLNSVAYAQRARALLDEGKRWELVMGFPEAFFVCERCCKEIVVRYKRDRGERANPETVRLHFQTIKAACNHAGVGCDDKTLSDVFSSESRVGQRSAKKLRDALVHGLSFSAIEEAATRHVELMGQVQVFLTAEGAHYKAFGAPLGRAS